MPHAYSVGVGFYLCIGSRYEEESLAGAAHFVEHMLFKGTERHPSAQAIAATMEGHGGVFNASTGQESTVLWAKVPRPHLPVALDVLFDMLRFSVIDGIEVEKERRVILEEILASQDVPEELVGLLVQDITWPNHPLGRDVAGTPESISSLTRHSLRSFLTEHYAPQNTVLSIAGNVQHDEVVALAQEYIGNWRATAPTACLPAPVINGSAPHAILVRKSTEQSHFVLHLPGFSRQDGDRYVLALLNVVLGEGMSSRLFLEIRERLGLAYAVESYVNFLSDTGIVGIYGAVAPKNLVSALSATLGQLRRLREEPMDGEALRVAKEYTKGRLLLGLEDTLSIASWFGRQEVLGGDLLSADEVIERIDSVTAEDVLRVASRVVRSPGARLAVVGPHRQTTAARLQDLLAADLPNGI